jgi:hypothetical protein
MVVSRRMDQSGLVEATLGGVVTSRDQAELVGFVRAAIAASGPVRVLLRLEHYVGWHHDARLDPDALWLRDDEDVTGIAIVGAPEWKAGVLTMVAQPLRRIPIAYFETEAAARQWLDATAGAPPPVVTREQVQ